jgi:hypothetical protein
MKTFREFILEAGATSTRLKDVVSGKISKTRDFSVLPQGKPSLSVLTNLLKNAIERERGIYPQQSNIRRGQDGAGVPSRSLDPVRISPGERGRITSSEIIRRSRERDANRNVPLTRREVPIPIRSRPTPSPTPDYKPTSRRNTPLTPKIRDQRAAAAGFSGPGSLPSGSNLYKQTLAGTTVGDDPIAVLRSAATPPKKPLPKSTAKTPSRGRGGGGGGSSGSSGVKPIGYGESPIVTLSRDRAQRLFDRDRRGGMGGMLAN